VRLLAGQRGEFEGFLEHFASVLRYQALPRQFLHGRWQVMGAPAFKSRGGVLAGHAVQVASGDGKFTLALVAKKKKNKSGAGSGIAMGARDGQRKALPIGAPSMCRGICDLLSVCGVRFDLFAFVCSFVLCDSPVAVDDDDDDIVDDATQARQVVAAIDDPRLSERFALEGALVTVAEE
jgi:hypothetical protein